ncbi:MAG: asparagine synthase (glutamine-hydrolyzing), partial [Bacteroidetes bacterium B1(2017)]
YVFKGHSDTETILYYLSHFGFKQICDLNGIFSIAFLDFKKSKLYLARDPFGVKPLYYYFNSNKLVFSSEVRPIKEIVTPLSLNKEALTSLLRLRYNPSPYTLFTEISKVIPGHYLEIGLDSPNLMFNQNTFDRQPPRNFAYNKQEASDKYQEIIENAVKIQLLSDVEIGIMLSGGIDSAVVAALAQKNSKKPLKAFTIGFEGAHFEDEIPEATETAKYLGLEHYYERINFEGFLKLIKECTRIIEEPLATTSIIPMYYLSRLSSKFVKVVLTGQGADEPLGGYKRYKAELLNQKLPTFLSKSINYLSKDSKFKNESIARGIKTLGISDDIKRFLRGYELFNENEIYSLVNNSDTKSSQAITNMYNLLDCQKNKNPVERMMSLDTRMNLSDDLLNYTDKISMNFSIECRVPLLDHNLVSFVESLPTKYKLNLFGSKIIHKNYAKKILPDYIVNRKKKGFQSPTKIWFEKESSILHDILLSNNSNFAKIFNLNAVKNLLNEHKAGFNKEKQIFLLLSIYYWFEIHDDVFLS